MLGGSLACPPGRNVEERPPRLLQQIVGRVNSLATFLVHFLSEHITRTLIPMHDLDLTEIDGKRMLQTHCI